MTLPVKKIYIDTRFKSVNSNSNSDFSFQLARNMKMPKKCVFWIEDVVIPHTWYTIEENMNDKLYIRVKLNSNVQDTYPNGPVWDNGISSFPAFVGWTDRMLKLTPKNYTGSTLTAEIQRLLNTVANGYFGTSYNSNTNCIFIVPTGENTQFQILTDLNLSTRLEGTWNLKAFPDGSTNTLYDAASDYNSSNFASCNDVLTNIDKRSPLYSQYKPFTSGFLDLRTIRNIYISSPNLGSFSTLGSRGESNIIKKVPVTSDYGYLIVDSFSSTHDFLDCSNLTLSSLEFHLKDVKGNFIPLHGMHVSFSIVFSTDDEDK